MQAPITGDAMQSRDFTVKLIATQFVKRYVKSNENDINDAESICGTMSQSSMKFVAVKKVEQQDIPAAHRNRSVLIVHPAAKAKQVRSLVAPAQ